VTIGVGAKEDDFFRVKPFDEDLEIRAELIGDLVDRIARIQEHDLANLWGGNRGCAHGDRLLIAGGSARGREGRRRRWCGGEWREGNEWGKWMMRRRERAGRKMGRGNTARDWKAAEERWRKSGTGRGAPRKVGETREV